jgi:hypothetical protein
MAFARAVTGFGGEDLGRGGRPMSGEGSAMGDGESFWSRTHCSIGEDVPFFPID